MSRTTTTQAVTITQEIQSFLEMPNISISCMVGVGAENADGIFEFTVPQNLHHFLIEKDLYTSFKTAHPAGYVKDDLWEYIDIILAGASSTAPSKYATWDANTKTWQDPANIVDLTKADTIIDINTLAGDKITSKYPIYRQINIARTTEAEAMYVWIDSVRAAAQAAKTEIGAATSIADIRAAEAAFNVALEAL